MSKEPQPIIISNWFAGISANPSQGFADMRNVDNGLIPTVIFPSLAASKKTSTAITGTPTWAVKYNDTNSTVFAVDTDGKVYSASDSSSDNWQTWSQVLGNTFTVTIASPAVFSATAHGLVLNDTVIFSTTGALPTGLTAGTTYYIISAGLTTNAFEVSTSQGGSAVNTSGTQSGTHTFRITTGDGTGVGGQGLAIFKDYLFKPRSNKLDVMKISNGVWTNNWQSLTSDTLTHPMVAGQDDILYGGQGVDTTNKLGACLFSVQQVASKIFTPSDATTYVFNSNALRLPYPYRIRCLAELGQQIMIGTFVGASLNSQAWQKLADIFPWDRTSATFALPVRLFEQGVNSMLNVGSNLFISAGQMGNIYIYNGFQAQSMFKFPRSTTFDVSSPYRDMSIAPQGLAYHKNRLFIAMTQTGSSAASGVYSINLDGTGLCMENTISTGNTDGNVSIRFVLPLRDFNFDYLIGWADGTAGSQGIDLVGENGSNGSYTAFVDSPIYSLGSNRTPKTFQYCDIYLDNPLSSGTAVRVQYRYARTGSWTTLCTFDFATYGAMQEMQFPAGSITARQVQFRVSFDGGTNFPRLKYVQLT